MPAVLTEPRAVTAQELELERAELLPARETLWITTRLYPYYNPGGLMMHSHPNPPFDVPQYDA
jgi:hypothetical protein